MMYLAAMEMFTRSINMSTPMQKTRATISQRVRVGRSIMATTCEPLEALLFLGGAIAPFSGIHFPDGGLTPSATWPSRVPPLSEDLSERVPHLPTSRAPYLFDPTFSLTLLVRGVMTCAKEGFYGGIRYADQGRDDCRWHAGATVSCRHRDHKRQDCQNWPPAAQQRHAGARCPGPRSRPGVHRPAHTLRRTVTLGSLLLDCELAWGDLSDD